MNTLGDQELLRGYAERRSEAAFTELVRRHIDVVYSAAFRMTGESHSAQDVTQAVFMALAQSAARLARHPVLSAWLHTTARNLAAKHVRATVRRQENEQKAAAMNVLLSDAPDASWEQIAPHLDSALGELDDAGRDAVMLRYFEKKSAHEMAQILGISDDAAQKRVSRAVDRLREFFSKRNVTIGASGLTILISANAVQAAPAALLATISTAVLAGTAVSTSTTLAATKLIAMTTLQKTLVAAALVATVGGGLFEAHQNSESQKQIQNLQQQQDSLNEQLGQLQRERDDATNQLDGVLAENAQLKSNSNQNELLKLRGQVAAASRAAADAAAKTQSSRNDSGQSQVEPDDLRNQTRANLETFFKLTNLSPEKADQYVALEVEMKRRQDQRLKALLGGTLSVAEAVRQRDQDKQTQDSQRRALLGPDGSAVLDSVADGMRNNLVKGLLGAVQANMGNNPLTQEQSDRLQSAIKAEVAANTMDDTDLFRPVDEWTQMVTERQQHVVQAAAEFLTPAQQETLQFLERASVAQQLQQRAQRRQALGLKQ